MHPDEVYEAWKRHRARLDAPDSFADRVLDAVRHTRPAGPSLFVRVVRVAVGVAACAACLFRIAQTVGLFLTP